MIDIGVIGVGNMGQHHARILSQHKRVNSTYIYDANESRANKIGSETNALVCSTLNSLFSCVDAVIIATPTHTHYAIAKDAMEHGLHVLIEKPICKTLDDAEKLCLIGNEFSDLVAGVGHVERFNPAAGVIKNTIQRPRYMSFVRHNPGSDRITDTTVVEDLMIHDIDLLNCFVNLDFESATLTSCGDKDTFVCSIWNDFPIVLSASRAATKKTRTVYIEDENYTIVADLADQSVYVYHKPEFYTLTSSGSFVSRANLQRVEPLHTELTAFLDCIHKKQQFPVTFTQGSTNLAICTMVIECNIKTQINKSERVPP